MSPTPSDARCAECGQYENAQDHYNPFRAKFHAFVAPTRVDEAPEGEPEGTMPMRLASGQTVHITPQQIVDSLTGKFDPQTLATPEQPAVTGEPDEELIRKPQTPTTGINAFAGKWKPNVSDKEFFERTQENDGISQTASRASRPTVESEGSAPDEAFLARLNHVEFANRIAMALGLNVGDEHPFDNLVQRVGRLREVAALKHPNDLRERNDRPAANNGALNTRATKAESQLSSTRTALQRVREAAQAVSDEWVSPTSYPKLVRLMDSLTAALTSTETQP